MSQHAFNLVAGVIFSAVALLHALRLYRGWDVVIAGKAIPVWVSWIGFVIAGFLSFAAFTL